MNILQRIKDCLREQRIRDHKADCNAAMKRGRNDLARGHWLLMVDEINARSPDQVARMEQAMGLSR